MSRENFPGYRHVTDIIDVFQKFSIPKKKLEEAADRGSRVHEAITAKMSDEFYVESEDTEKYIEAFANFSYKYNFEKVLVKKRFFDEKLMITGEIDCLLKFEGDPYPTIVDFKTSRSENAPMWTLQGTFYKYLCDMNGIQTMNTFKFLQLGGSYGMFFVRDYKYTDEGWDVCQAALRAHKYFYPESR